VRVFHVSPVSNCCFVMSSGYYSCPRLPCGRRRARSCSGGACCRRRSWRWRRRCAGAPGTPPPGACWAPRTPRTRTTCRWACTRSPGAGRSSVHRCWLWCPRGRGCTAGWALRPHLPWGLLRLPPVNGHARVVILLVLGCSLGGRGASALQLGQAQPSCYWCWPFGQSVATVAANILQAIAAMDAALRADPADAEVLLSLGVSHTNEMEAAEALGYLQRWLGQHPRHRASAAASAPPDASQRHSHVVRAAAGGATPHAMLCPGNAAPSCAWLVPRANRQRIATSGEPNRLQRRECVTRAGAAV
jgi:hypothetical protein